MNLLSHLPNSSKVWIFQANQILNEKEMTFIHKEVSNFLVEWNAHGSSLSNGFELVDSLFLIIGVDESKAVASGCSKDSLTRKIQEIGNHINIDFFNRLNIAYLDKNNQIEIKNLNEFKAGLQNDSIRLNTIIYNNLIETKEDLELRWKIPVQKSWLHNMVKAI